MRHLALALLLAACGDNVVPDVPKLEACAEQAEAWCARAGYPSSGCRTVYATSWCGATDGADVPADLQLECLEDIASSSHPGCVPSSCEDSWSIPRE